MLDQTSVMLLISGLLIAVPILVGISIAFFGSGRRAVWVAALVAFVLTVLGLRLATAIYSSPISGQLSGVVQVGLGFLFSVLGLMLGLGICTVALIRSARAHRWAWVVVLALGGALPLLASLAVVDLDVLVIGMAHKGEPVVSQLIDLALLLPPIGCAVLVAFGVWSAPRHWPDPDVAPDGTSASS